MACINSKILKYLFELASGNCNITEEDFDLYREDTCFQNVLVGLKSIQEIIQNKNLQIQELENEKIHLNIELRDRVKNNMQVISSLLSLQANYIDNDEAKSLIRYSQYRINSMSMIHEMLYQSEDLAKIEYSEYIKLLASSITTSMKGHNHNITFSFDLPPIMLNIDTAIPLGLILNEIITNSLKYGIKDNNAGEISIKLQQNKYPNYILQIGDNGVGYEKDIDFRSSDTLGLMLIHKLTLQLKGNIEKINNGEGTNYILSFKRID